MDIETLKGLGIFVVILGGFFVFASGRLMRAIDSIEVALNKKTSANPAKDLKPDETGKTK